MRTFFNCLLYIGLSSLQTFGQVNISSIVIDRITKQPIEGVSVYPQNNRNIGVATNHSGAFQLFCPMSNHDDIIILTIIGYESVEMTVGGLKKQKSIELLPVSHTIEQVTVTYKSTATQLVKRAQRRFRRNYARRLYSAEFTLSNYLFNYTDSTKHIHGYVNAQGSINSRGVLLNYEHDRLAIDTLGISSSLDSLCAFNVFVRDYNYYMLFDPVRLILAPPTSCVFLNMPQLFTEMFYENYHFSIDSTLTTVDSRVIVIDARQFRGINHDSELPEDEFRKKYRHELQNHKERINYSPENKLFKVSERVLDSVFYSGLRQSMKVGNPTRSLVRLYIDRPSMAIEKIEIKSTIINPSKVFQAPHTNTTVKYLNIEGRYYLQRIEIVAESRECELFSYVEIDFNSFKIGRRNAIRISRKALMDWGQTIEFIDINKEGWERVMNKDILETFTP